MSRGACCGNCNNQKTQDEIKEDIDSGKAKHDENGFVPLIFWCKKGEVPKPKSYYTAKCSKYESS
jgi:hypothetical protein